MKRDEVGGMDIGVGGVGGLVKEWQLNFEFKTSSLPIPSLGFPSPHAAFPFLPPSPLTLPSHIMLPPPPHPYYLYQ